MSKTSKPRKRTAKQKAATVMAVVLASILLLSFVISGISAFAITQSDIDALKKKQKALKEQKSQSEAVLKDLKANKSGLLEQKGIIDAELETLEKQIANSAELVNALNTQISSRQKALDSAIEDEKSMIELYRKRVRAMEEMGDASYISVLLQANSFADLLERADIMSAIMKKDQEIISSLARKQQAIAAEQESLANERDEQLAVKEELAEQEEELFEKAAEAQKLIDDMIALMSEASSSIAHTAAEIEKYDKEIAKGEEQLARELEELRKKSQGKYVGGVMTWPVPGYYTIPSGGYFDWRIHPITGKRTFHYGIDIPAPKNTAIVAANSGTVVLAQYASGWGNYQIVDHGGGTLTYYAHQNKFVVGEGTTVLKGQQIGYVGTTGASTGNHLHFGVHEDGSWTNPLNKLTAG